MATMILYYYYSWDDRYERKRAEVKEVYDLIESLHTDFNFLLSAEHSNFYSVLSTKGKTIDKRFAYNKLFKSAFDETFKQYDKFLKDIEEKISIDDEMLNIHYQLKSVGLTGKSLRLKLSLLSEWWEQLKQSMPDQVFDWGLEKTRRLSRKFLAHLNSILGSLSKVFPLLEPVMEFKEMIESANEMMDEFYLT